MPPTKCSIEYFIEEFQHKTKFVRYFDRFSLVKQRTCAGGGKSCSTQYQQNCFILVAIKQYKLMW